MANRKMFNFTLCDRKNGTRFIKIIYYDSEAGGWVEVARINLSKNEWVQDNFTMKDIFDELNR